MTDLRNKTRPLPAALKPERLTRMSLACRLGWHEWHWGEISPGGVFQERICMRCGRNQERSRW